VQHHQPLITVLTIYSSLIKLGTPISTQLNHCLIFLPNNNGYNISQSRFSQTNSHFIISIINAHITVHHHQHTHTHITPRKHRKRTKHRKHISSTHQQRRKITLGGSGSTVREAIEEKEMKMKRWRGI